MATLENFNANEHESPGFDPIPAGDYPMIPTKSEMKPNKAGNGNYIKMTFQVVAGPYQNRLVYQNFNWTTTRTDKDGLKAIQIGKAQFGELCRAVGIPNPKDTSEVHDKVFIGHVIIEKSKDPQFNDSNKVKEFKTQDGKSVRKAGTGKTAAPTPSGQPAAIPVGAAGTGRPWA